MRGPPRPRSAARRRAIFSDSRIACLDALPDADAGNARWTIQSGVKRCVSMRLTSMLPAPRGAAAAGTAAAAAETAAARSRHRRRTRRRRTPAAAPTTSRRRRPRRAPTSRLIRNAMTPTITRRDRPDHEVAERRRRRRRRCRSRGSARRSRARQPPTTRTTMKPTTSSVEPVVARGSSAPRGLGGGSGSPSIDAR